MNAPTMPAWFADSLKWAMLEDKRNAILKVLRAEQLNQSNAKFRLLATMERYKAAGRKVDVLRRALLEVELEQAQTKAPNGELTRKPDGYAYRYHDAVRFNGGETVNGGKPIESIPFYFGRTP